MRWVIRSKIHKATVTEANLDYVGSRLRSRGCGRNLWAWPLVPGLQWV